MFPRISIEYQASCFPSNTTLLAFGCYKQNCFKVGYVSSDFNKFEVQLGSPFVSGSSYMITIQNKDGYLKAESELFTVQETCACTPSIVITSPMESCYITKDV